MACHASADGVGRSVLGAEGRTPPRHSSPAPASISVRSGRARPGRRSAGEHAAIDGHCGARDERGLGGAKRRHRSRNVLWLTDPPCGHRRRDTSEPRRCTGLAEARGKIMGRSDVWRTGGSPLLCMTPRRPARPAMRAFVSHQRAIGLRSMSIRGGGRSDGAMHEVRDESSEPRLLPRRMASAVVARRRSQALVAHDRGREPERPPPIMCGRSRSSERQRRLACPTAAGADPTPPSNASTTSTTIRTQSHEIRHHLLRGADEYPHLSLSPNPRGSRRDAAPITRGRECSAQGTR